MSAQAGDVAAGTDGSDRLKTGLDVLLDDGARLLHGKRVGLITNMTGVDRELRSTVDLLANHPDVHLVALFGPEHGVRGNVQAGDHVDDSRDAATGLPVHSLYGGHREPTPEMLRDIDVLVFDIQDVGARFYTYPYTLAYALQAAKRAGIAVVVLDRPNPIGGVLVEGPVLEPAQASFVGLYPIPVRHGMTIGELAGLFNTGFGIGARLQVVRMQGWRRDAAEPGAALPWVPPSPNMPTPDTALVYPGTALLEGTNLSEGRGTTRPFEIVGAPWIDATALAARMNALGLPGVRFRPTWFTPSFSKHAGVACAGVQLHVSDRAAFRPVRTGVALVATLQAMYPEAFRFEPVETPFFDKLAGNDWIRQALQVGRPWPEIEARWQPELVEFEQLRRRYLLY
ncbi:exo-beta-N-acetylmuramidase NamZ family protein [Luteimonas sp. RIT-PG2_3]